MTYYMTEIEKELINEKLNGVYKAIEASADVQNVVNKNIMEMLHTIDAKVTKTNGSIAVANREIAENKLLFEKEMNEFKVNNLNHVINCPVKDKHEKLERKVWYITGIAIGIMFVVEILIKIYT